VNRYSVLLGRSYTNMNNAFRPVNPVLDREREGEKERALCALNALMSLKRRKTKKEDLGLFITNNYTIIIVVNHTNNDEWPTEYNRGWSEGGGERGIECTYVVEAERRPEKEGFGLTGG